MPSNASSVPPAAWPDTWDEEVDLLVIGFGAAGASAALDAQARGASVAIVDSYDGGGATAMSGGVVYAGATRYQTQAGVEDSVEETAKYLQYELKGAASPETIARYARESAGIIDWLAELGVPFEGTPWAEKTILPPDGHHLYYAGNEKFPSYKAIAKPAMRGHRAVGSGMTGHVLFDALRARVEERGIAVHRHCPARRLIMDGEGRVIGAEVEQMPAESHALRRAIYAGVVPLKPFAADKEQKALATCRALEAAKPGQRRFIRARRGVVLATGGFELDLERIGRHRPILADNYKSLMRLMTLGSDGSGLTLGEAAGGAVTAMDSFYLGRVLAPPNALLRGILVNRDGARIINEEAYGGFVGEAIASQPGGEAWLILSGASFREALKEIATGGRIAFRFYGLPTLLNVLAGRTKRAGTIARLAGKCGIDAAHLAQTVAEYDADARAGTDRLEKTAANVQPLGDGPFYALCMSMNNRVAFTQTLTLGGLRVEEESGEIVRGDGSPIAGLYGAGRVAAGLCSRGYISGMSLGDAVFAARRAVAHALRDMPA